MTAAQGHLHHDRLVTFDTQAVDDIFAEVKERLRQATESHTNPGPQDVAPSNGRSCYVASDSDLRMLLDHLSHSIRRLQQMSPTTSFASSATPFTISNPGHLTARTAIDPATTISVSEASFPPVVGDKGHDAPCKHDTTATIVSRDSITEITWLVNQESQANHSFESPTARAVQNGHGRAQRQTSMVVLTNGDDNDEAASLHSSNQASERGPSLLTRLRRKTVRFVQPEAPPSYGGYLNEDYKPRRESSLFRMRAILDRLEPSRPKQDAAVFAALTGAQPIQPTHDLEQDRSMYLHQSCSEDGRQHRCTQHESAPTSPG